MKTSKLIKIGAALAALLMIAVCLCACSKTVNLKVNDMGAVTEIEAKTGTIIGDVLKEAGITLGEKDVTEPAADAELTEDVTEIVVKRYAKVTLVKDGEEVTVELVGGTVADALAKAGITLGDKESTDVEDKAYLKDGMKINVAKEVTVTLKADGETKEIATKAATVEALLEEQNITLGKDDEVSEKLDAKLADGMAITVKRVVYKEEKKKEKIEFSNKEEYDSSMAEGTSKVKQDGVEGEKEVTYKVKYVDGKEESREVVSEKIIKEAVDRIIVYGTASNSGGSGGSGSSGRYETGRETYYDCDGSGHGYTEIFYSDGSSEVIRF